jgi:hypothetical protein
MHSLVRRIPMALGPLIGGAFIQIYGRTTGTRIAFSAAFVLGMVALVAQQLLISDRDRTMGKKEAEANPLRALSWMSADLRALLVSDILVRFCEQIPYAFLAIWSLDHVGISPIQFGTLTAIEMVTAMLVYIPVAYLADRGGKKPFVAVTFVFFTLFPLVLLASRSMPMLVLAFIIRGLKEFGEPTRKALIMDLAPEGRKASTFGVYYLLRDVIVSVAAFGGAFLWRISPATNLLTARSTGPAQSHISRIKHAVPVAALRAERTPEVVEALTEWYPQFTPADSTLETSFANVGAVIHPAITLLNAARIENDQGRFEFYMDGISPRVAEVLAAVDRERKAVAALLGVEVPSLVEWLASAYRATGSDLFEAVRANEGYRGITAPSTLEHRYILEDVPMSLVPIASAGRAFGLNTRAIDALIFLAGIIMDTNYWTRGRTLQSLGLAGLSPGEIRRIAETGEWDG